MVTGNRDVHPIEAVARAFVEEGRILVGWPGTGNIRDLAKEAIYKRAQGQGYTAWHATNALLKLRDELVEGSAVVAYRPGNLVVAVGRVEGPYEFVRVPGFSYEWHSREVQWTEPTIPVSRFRFPDPFKTQLARRGTIIVFQGSFDELEDIYLRSIPGGG